MDKTRLVIRKRFAGEVDYNDGQFAEVQTCATEGDDKDLFVDTIQIHREDTENMPEEFKSRFPVGMWLDIVITTEISPSLDEGVHRGEGGTEKGMGRSSVQ